MTLIILVYLLYRLEVVVGNIMLKFGSQNILDYDYHSINLDVCHCQFKIKTCTLKIIFMIDNNVTLTIDEFCVYNNAIAQMNV